MSSCESGSSSKPSSNVRKLWALGLCLVAAPVLGGCQTHGQTGAAIGSVLGAGGGYLIGKNNGNRTAWALGGAAVGAGLGYLLGDAEDQREHYDQHHGPHTIDGSDGYHRSEPYDDRPGYERRTVVRRRVYYEGGSPYHDEPSSCDPRW